VEWGGQADVGDSACSIEIGIGVVIGVVETVGKAHLACSTGVQPVDERWMVGVDRWIAVE
jgi:hypothetical protein